MPAEPTVLSYERVLLVEGSNDRDFFRALLAANNRARVHVESYGGKPELRRWLRAFVVEERFQLECRWLGVSRDADGDPTAAFDSIVDALIFSGEQPPQDPRLESATDRRRIRVIVIPDHQTTGELEDLIWRAIQDQATDEADCIAVAFTCLANLTRGANRKPKAFTYAYLSTFDPPDRSVGAAALAGGVLNLQSIVYQPLLELIPTDDEEL